MSNHRFRIARLTGEAIAIGAIVALVLIVAAVGFWLAAGGFVSIARHQPSLIELAFFGLCGVIGVQAVRRLRS